jgi:ABC-2 type transport system ATP-binding protein
MTVLLEARNLTKFFRHNWTMRRFGVLHDLNLSVHEGEIFGLIGPNGAGKTTTFKLILGLLRPSAGTVSFCGAPLTPAARSRIGFLPEHPYFYDYLTVRETLDLFARLYGIEGGVRRRRVNDLIEQVHLQHKTNASLRSLSKGTLQRVGIAQAILNHPQLVILDEPMSGLDPAGRRNMRELILSLRAEGSTVIFSSHILPDTEALCDRVGILTQGRLREVIELRANRGPTSWLMTIRNVDDATMAKVGQLVGDSPSKNGGGSWHVRLTREETVGSVLDVVREASGTIESLNPVHPSLEERFIHHVGDATSID